VNFDLDHSIAVLERTPGVLEALLAQLPPEWIAGNEGPDTWSPFDVVGHLIDGEEAAWMPRARLILAQGVNRWFEPFDPFRHLTVNQGRELKDLLAQFRRVRDRNLAELRGLNLSQGQFQLTGEHPTFGSVTLAQLLATWVAHDLGHIGQITRVMAKQYREAVGPWEAFLPVLHR
jgi:hypothetical protein